MLPYLVYNLTVADLQKQYTVIVGSRQLSEFGKRIPLGG